MASASVVGQRPGQHRLDAEPPLFVFKVSGVRKKISPPRRVSRERMLLRSSGGECGAVPAQRNPGCAALSPAAAGDAALRGGPIPGDGCAAAPRRSDPRGEEEDNADRDTHAENTSSNRDSHRSCRAQKSRVGVERSDAAAQRDARRRRDAPHGDSGLPLERLTQARRGVVRLVRPEPSRREAWSIFTQDPRVRTERGEGHRFEAKAVTQDWCDACSRKITAQAVTCQNCSYTCHLECQRRVQLDCNQRDRQCEQSPSPRVRCSSTPPRCKQTVTKEEEDGGTKVLSVEEVKTRIEAYNAQVSENGMNLASDGSYTGFIKVHLRLSRPVTVCNVEALGSEGGHSQAPSEVQGQAECKQNDKRTSFYLPCDSVKHLHISSQTTTSEVIQNLLKKFMMLDNPCKFALYKQTHRDGQDLFQKLPLSEHPLLLRLIAGPDLEKLSFVLKENETGEVEWHAFSVPELQNFLVILEKEEAERVRAVEQKYAAYRQKLQQALQRHDP